MWERKGKGGSAASRRATCMHGLRLHRMSFVGTHNTLSSTHTHMPPRERNMAPLKLTSASSIEKPTQPRCYADLQHPCLLLAPGIVRQHSGCKPVGRSHFCDGDGVC